MRITYKTFIICLIAVMASASQLSAEPEIIGPIIRMGFSPRIKSESLATFKCRIKNPDDRGHRIELRIIPSEGLGFTKNIYSASVNVPARTMMEYECPMMYEGSEKYLLEFLVDGSKSSKSGESIMTKSAPAKSVQIGLMTDAEKVSFGAFIQLPEYKDKYVLGSFTCQSFPDDWYMLKDLKVLVLLEPDYSRMSARQYQAIIDFVYQGGTLILANPKTALDAVGTPLTPLLPVSPVKIRTVFDVPALKKAFPAFKGWEKGDDFVESILKPGAIPMIMQDEFPLFASYKYGMGSTRFSAIPIIESSYKDCRDVWSGILGVFLSHKEITTDYTSFKSCLDDMTGFSVPPSGQVTRILMLYMLVLGAVILAGVFFRRTGICWTAGVIIAFLTTFHILSKASSAAKTKGRLFSAVEVCFAGREASVSDSYYSIFSSYNETLSLKAPTAMNFFSTIPRGDAGFGPGAFAFGNQMQAGGAQKSNDQGLQASPFLVSRDNGLPEIPDLVIKSNAAKQFRMLSSNGSKKFLRLDKLPSLEYSAVGVSMKPWQLPDGMNPDSAVIVFTNGSLPAKIENGRVSFEQASGEAFFSSDEILKDLRKSLEEAERKGVPYLALVEKIGETILPAPPGTSRTQGRKVTAIPLVNGGSTQVFMINPEQVLLSPGDSNTRMIMSGNSFKISEVFGSNVSDYFFNFKIPEAFPYMSIEEISIAFTYMNQGGNILAEPCLESYLLSDDTGPGGSKVSRPPPKDTPPRMKGKAKEPGVYVFSGEDLKKLINPFTGAGRICLEVKEKSPIMDPLQKRRANKWFIRELKISVKAAVPKVERAAVKQD